MLAAAGGCGRPPTGRVTKEHDGMRREILGALALCAATAVAAHADAKRITFTTKSEEARKHVLEAIRRIESFEQAPRIQEEAKAAIALDPDFAWAQYLMSASSFPPPTAKPYHDKALERVKKASPGEQAYLDAARLNREQKVPEALAAFQKLRQEYAGDRMVVMMVGQLSLAQGKPDDAQKSFEEAIKLDGSTPRVYAFMANTAIIGGDYAKARTYLQTAMSKRAAGTAPGAVYYPLALSYLYEGKPDPAIDTPRTFLGEYKKVGADAQFPEVFIRNSIARINLENGRL